LASCSYDGKVIIYRESPANNWTQIYVHAKHDSSVNSISWAPYEFGFPMLACASSDGTVSIIFHQANGWEVYAEIKDGALGCNSVCWAPFDPAQNPPVKQLVTGSCDNTVKLHRETEPRHFERSILAKHTDWVRDVAWAPSSGLPSQIIASCSESKVVQIHEQDSDAKGWDQGWVTKSLKPEPFSAPLWRVSWSVTGHVLAVSSGDHEVTLWKQTLDKNWINLDSSVSEAS